MKNILVTVDDLKDADQLMDHAVRIAKLTKAKIWIVHVTELVPNDFISREAGPQFLYDKRMEDRKKEAAYIKKLTEQTINEHKIPVEGLIIDGPVVNSITKMVLKNKIDLLVAGHKKRSFLNELFTANKKKNLIDELNVPLLAIPLK